MIWLVVLAAGLAGAFLRAVTSSTPQPWGGPRIVDTAMGGLASVVVWLILGVLPWTSATVAKLDTAMEQGLVVFVLGYIGSHVYVNRGADWLAAIGDRWFRGAAAPNKRPPAPPECPE